MYVNESQDFLTVSRLLLALRRRWLSIAFWTIVGTIGTAALLISLPNVFQSESMLYIKIGRGTIAIDPATSASGSHISLMDSRQTEINSVKEMLSSRVVIERAVRAVGVERVMEHKPWYESVIQSVKGGTSGAMDQARATLTGKTLEELKTTFDGLSATEVETIETTEEAVARVMEKFSVKSTKDSYTLKLTCRAFSPTLARDLCQAIVDEYRKVHVEAHSVRGSLAFFEQQHSEAKQLLQSLEFELRDTKNRTQMMTVPGKQELVLAEIKQLQADLLKASTEVAAARARDIELVAKANAMPERIKMDQTAGLANDASDKMRNQLFELEMLEKELTNRYTKEHPLVVQVREQLITAKSIYGSQSTERTQVNETINPNRQALELDRFRNLSTLEGLKAQQQDLVEKIAAAEGKAEKVNGDEVTLNMLERQVQLARADVMNYGHKQEEARLLDRLDSANLTDVSLPQPPSLELEKVGPKRMLLTLAGTACFFVAGCAMAIFFDISKDYDATERALASSIDISSSTAGKSADTKLAQLIDKDVERLAQSSTAHSSPWLDN